MKHELKQINGIEVLFKDGKPATCPFKNAIPIQDNFKQLQIINNECSSACPHFVQSDLAQVKQIVLKCVPEYNFLILADD